MNDILSTLRKDEYSNKCAIDLLLAVRALLGEEGPCYFEPGIISHVSIKVSLQYPLAKRERKLPEDVISAFYKVSMDEELEKYRHSGRTSSHEGFHLSSDGEILTMLILIYIHDLYLYILTLFHALPVQTHYARIQKLYASSPSGVSLNPWCSIGKIRVVSCASLFEEETTKLHLISPTILYFYVK